MSYFARSRILGRRDQDQDSNEAQQSREGGRPVVTSPKGALGDGRGQFIIEEDAGANSARGTDEPLGSTRNDHPLSAGYRLPVELPPIRTPISPHDEGFLAETKSQRQDDPFQYDLRSPTSPSTSSIVQRLSRKATESKNARQTSALGSTRAGGGRGQAEGLPVQRGWQPVISPPMPQGSWGGSGLGVDDDDGDDGSSPAPDYYYEARSDDGDDEDADLALASPHPLQHSTSNFDLSFSSSSASLAGLNFIHPTAPPSAAFQRPPFTHQSSSTSAASAATHRDKLQQLVEEKLNAKYNNLKGPGGNGIGADTLTRLDTRRVDFEQTPRGGNPFADHLESPYNEKLSPFRDPSSSNGVDAYSLKERQGYRAPVSPGVEEILRYEGQPPLYQTKDRTSPPPSGSDSHHDRISPSKSVKSFRSNSGKSSRSNKSSKTQGSHARAVGGVGADVKTKRELRMEAARLRKRKLVVLGAVVGVCVFAIGIPVAYTLSKNASTPVDTGPANSTASPRPTSVEVNTTASSFNASAYSDPENRLNPLSYPKDLSIQQGSDGALVNTYINGSIWVFTYTNPFGGDFYFDPLDPYTLGGKAQSWSPRIGNETWTWGTDLVRGVNLGGWLVTEPFIVPALYEAYPGSYDEWTLSEVMTAAGPDVLEQEMRIHYESFIVEQDFAMIAAAGMNYVRINLGFWAVEKVDEEPFLEGVSWEYFVRAIGWARKYGLRILLDLHSLPGSQNGWNHSGKSGSVNWMYGVMGIANGQRTLNVLRTITEFISQPQYSSVVTILSLVNEVESAVIGLETLQAFYYQAYLVIRAASGLNQGPIVLGHTGFGNIADFTSFMPGADRFALDQHPYLAFAGKEVYAQGFAADWAQICTWSAGINASQTTYGLTLGGEWSPAINDCGLYLNGINSTALYETSGVGSCDTWNDWASWSSEVKANISQTALVTMDSLTGGWFAWTWKIGNATSLGTSSSPFWHVKLGLAEGWWPTDPRASIGQCAALGAAQDIFAGTFPASATGGGDGILTATALANYSAWPPTTISYSTSLGPFSQAQVALMPTWTQTASPATLTQMAVPSGGADAGDGWYATADNSAAYAAVSGCTYLNYWNATDPLLLPTAACTGSAARRRGMVTVRPAGPTPTTPPVRRSYDGQ